MKLFLDIGNTAMKWRSRDVKGVEGGGWAHGRDWQPLVQRLAEQLGGGQVSELWVASVAGLEADRDLAQVLQQRLLAKPQFYYSSAADAGVRNAYSEPERLGVDRWLAMIEVHGRHGEAVVIDCGSAMTVDAVTRAGEHLGGYIVPGVQMLRDSLFKGTARVRVTENVAPSVQLGRSTSACVEHGLRAMSVGFVEFAIGRCRAQLSAECPVYLTGGDAEWLRDSLPGGLLHDPDLVLDGFERVIAARNGGAP